MHPTYVRGERQMTTIKTTCGTCGDVELTPADLALELDAAGDGGSYRFRCPDCGDVSRRPASARVVSVLLATGVVYEMVPTGPITEFEISGFVTALDREPNPFRLLAG